LLLFFFSIIITLTKNIEILVYKIILIFTKIYILWIVNKTLFKYQKTKKNRIYQGDIFTIEDIYNILAQEKIDK